MGERNVVEIREIVEGKGIRKEGKRDRQEE